MTHSGLGRTQLSDAFLQRERRATSPAVFVLGTGITGFAMARALHRSDVLVVGVDARAQYPTSSSSVWSDVCLTADFDDARLIDWLLREGARCSHRPALMVSTDEQVKLIAADGGRLATTFAVEKSSESATTLLMNKQLFTARALQEGWPVPRTWSIEDREALQSIAPTLPYPVILKPHVKNREFRSAAPAKAFRCESAVELLAGYDAFAAVEPEAVVQEWVHGGDSDIRFSFHYFSADGVELSRFEGRKIRQWVPYCGSSASATRCDDVRVAEMSATMLRACGAVGFCSVEYKHDRRSDSFIIMEPTIGRPNLQLGAALANGIDLVTTAYQHLTGVPVTPTAPTARRATWLIVPSDLRSAAFYRSRGELTWWRWMRSLSWPLVPAVWTLTDGGLWRALTAKIVSALRRRLRRLTAR